jgi:hypothetical protein
VWATWSKVLWLSLRTITRQFPPRPESGPAVRGRSTVEVDIALIMRQIPPRSDDLKDRQGAGRK